jgi:hypothetical protein
MTIGYSPSNICSKLEHEEYNGKDQLTKKMNGQLGDGQMPR